MPECTRGRTERLRDRSAARCRGRGPERSKGATRAPPSASVALVDGGDGGVEDLRPHEDHVPHEPKAWGLPSQPDFRIVVV